MLNKKIHVIVFLLFSGCSIIDATIVAVQSPLIWNPTSGYINETPRDEKWPFRDQSRDPFYPHLAERADVYAKGEALLISGTYRDGVHVDMAGKLMTDAHQMRAFGKDEKPEYCIEASQRVYRDGAYFHNPTAKTYRNLAYYHMERHNFKAAADNYIAASQLAADSYEVADDWRAAALCIEKTGDLYLTENYLKKALYLSPDGERIRFQKELDDFYVRMKAAGLITPWREETAALTQTFPLPITPGARRGAPATP